MKRDAWELIPLQINIAVYDLLTPEQRKAIGELMRKPTVQKLVVWLDGLAGEKGFLAFNLYGNRGPEDVFLSGLIEPDGSVHT